MIAQHNVSAPKLLKLVICLMKIEELDLPLQRNQNYIVKYLMELKDKVLYGVVTLCYGM